MIKEIPFWCKYSLSVEEASSYFRIGRDRLRSVISNNPQAEYILWNGNRPQIKRSLFEKFLDRENAI